MIYYYEFTWKDSIIFSAYLLHDLLILKIKELKIEGLQYRPDLI